VQKKNGSHCKETNGTKYIFIKYIFISLINYLFFAFKAVLLNDVENVSILGLDQGCVLLFSAISSSHSRVNNLFFFS
jgi:uncharacterized membrane protein